MNTLEMDNVTKVYHDGPKEFRAIDQASLAVKEGEFVAIMGPSGSGKSTLLSIAGALLTPTSGQIRISGKDLASLSANKVTQLRLDKLGFIFQSANLVPYLKIKDQLGLIGKLGNLSKKATEIRTRELLEHFGLYDRLSHFPSELSGGQRQRVAIARALMNDPEIIFADEPTASLDSKRGLEVVEMLADEIKTRNKSGIMVTHDERVLHLCDRVITIKDGKLV
ncbi:hemin ABC transporter ATP-binding protein [Virgibacillus phasianinus]|uniref:Putative hemin import ATP-binding protein HrtA n=1 Tax=Virgibacillus phasianinus TaxID=2017483 RepID=A0A220U0Y7_9BACI|nr:ABC transporter ATP-binding protein [Virgibacillus phasianinus]ASK61563.1 hemin ABC transporter ATP-binding protein [Virgibacillus phasianinus]